MSLVAALLAATVSTSTAAPAASRPLVGLELELYRGLNETLLQRDLCRADLAGCRLRLEARTSTPAVVIAPADEPLMPWWAALFVGLATGLVAAHLLTSH